MITHYGKSLVEGAPLGNRNAVGRHGGGKKKSGVITDKKGNLFHVTHRVEGKKSIYTHIPIRLGK